MRRTFTEAEVLVTLQRAIAESGSQIAWANAHDLSGAYVSDVLAGKRGPGDSILKALGLTKVISYQREDP